MSTGISTNGRGLPAVMQPDQIDRGDASQPVVRFTVNDMEVMAKRAAASRMFGMDENQLITLMLICDAEGRHPMMAIRRYHVIQNRPAMRTDAILGDMLQLGWTVEWTTDSRDRVVQEAVFIHPRKCPNGKSVSWTTEDAKIAGLAGKDNWKNHTPAMLRARVISTACRMLDPGIITGIYSTEEVEDMRPTAIEASVAVSPERSALRSAIDDAKGRATSAIEAPSPPRSEFATWLEARIADVHERWSEIARGAGIAPGKPVSRAHVGNHLIKAWIADETLVLGDVQTDGKQDNAKVAQIISAAWDEDPAELAAEIDEFLKAELVTRAAKAGIAIPASDESTDEAQGTADDDPPGAE